MPYDNEYNKFIADKLKNINLNYIRRNNDPLMLGSGRCLEQPLIQSAYSVCGDASKDGLSADVSLDGGSGFAPNSTFMDTGYGKSHEVCECEEKDNNSKEESLEENDKMKNEKLVVDHVLENVSKGKGKPKKEKVEKPKKERKEKVEKKEKPKKEKVEKVEKLLKEFSQVAKNAKGIESDNLNIQLPNEIHKLTPVANMKASYMTGGRKGKKEKKEKKEKEEKKENEITGGALLLEKPIIRRAKKVKEIMKEKGLSLIEASKYIKANNIKY